MVLAESNRGTGRTEIGKEAQGGGRKDKPRIAPNSQKEVGDTQKSPQEIEEGKRSKRR